ncbi:MAG: hypothetical protein GAK30_02781 [Paracidovorax wautersii]|uniref:Uncharacterized protein n=1 Tax=Paracidovorax wautersii TaxID=1177982 RepID=A0A7V8FMG1_9BURK|nr:MAG: hypothetical protein GAK30_02781 [Paracidovorax wautersii]
MKPLVLLLVALFAVWLWRSRRPPEDGEPPAKKAGPQTRAPKGIAPPQPMVRCAVCSLHLPRRDAIAGTAARHYCGRDHFDQAETSRATAPPPSP